MYFLIPLIIKKGENLVRKPRLVNSHTAALHISLPFSALHVQPCIY